MGDQNEENLDIERPSVMDVQPDPRLMKWPIFHFLSAKVISTIRIAMVFGTDGNEAVFVTKDDMVYALGKNQDGCLGLGHAHPVLSPEVVTTLCSIKIRTFAHTVGPNTLALTEDGKVYMWGSRSPEYANYMLPYRIFNDISVVSIACGGTTFMALTNIGTVYTWNSKNKASLNDSSYNTGCNNRSCSKKLIHLPKDIANISCGYSINMAVTQGGLVYAWGSNSGQLGCNTTSGIIADPVKVNGIPGCISKVACGYCHTLALSTNGTVYAWGENNFGQLGIGRLDKYIFHPSKVQDLPGIKDIGAMYCSHISAAITHTNRVYIWGLCNGQSVRIPMSVSIDCIHDVFCYFSTPAVMHEPLICQEGSNSQIIHCLKTAFNDPTTSDLIIKVEEKPIHVHKAILKIRSPYFKTMFQRHWLEDKESEIKHDIFCYEVYEGYLRYLYTDELTLSAKHTTDLLVLADMHNDVQLKAKCLQHIKDNITENNAIYLYSRAATNNIKELQDTCFAFALGHMTAVVQSDDFKNLNPALMTTFIVEAAKAHVFIT